MAKEFLASTPLASVLPSNPLVSVTTGCRMDSAMQVLAQNRILSVPVMQKGEYHGCISVNDVLKNLVAGLKAKNAHWLEAGAAAFSADDLVAVGKELGAKTVGDLEHAGGLWLLNAGDTTSLLDLIINSFDIRDSHHVHHRVYICSAATSAHTTSTGATTVVNATRAAASSGKLTVTHVMSHFDVVRVLAENKGSLGELAGQTLDALGLDEGAVFCVPANTPALEAFGRMAVDEKSSLGLTDPATGKLVANLSVSALRGLTAPQMFASLLAPAADFQAAQHGGALPPVPIVTPSTTFGDLLDLLVGGKLHRVYVVDQEGKPTSIITLTDVLRLVVA